MGSTFRSEAGSDGHSYGMRIILFAVAVFAAAAVFSAGPGAVLWDTPVSGNAAFAAEPRAAAPGAGDSLPTLVDLGSDKCKPCRMMAPIIEEIKDELRGRLTVVYYDVWKDPAPGREYGIYGIPTLIFLDGNGKEIYRHVGYWPKEAILDKWKELGYDFR